MAPARTPLDASWIDVPTIRLLFNIIYIIRSKVWRTSSSRTSLAYRRLPASNSSNSAWKDRVSLWEGSR